MKNIVKMAIIACVLVFTRGNIAAQNSIVTDTFHVNGNCSMCQTTIEKACTSMKAVRKASWDKDTKILTVTYDTRKATADNILKRVARFGYDNSRYRAKDATYAKLHTCCLYPRE